MDTTREDPTVRSSGRIQRSSAADTFVLGRPFRPRRRGWGLGAAAVVVALVAGSMATGVRSPSQHPALRLVSDATVRPSHPVSYRPQAGPKGVWRQVPLPAAVRGAGAPGASTAGSPPAAGAPSGSFQVAPGSGSGTAANSSGASAPQAPAAPAGTAPLPAEPLPQLPAAVPTPTDSPTPTPSASPTVSASASPSGSGAAAEFAEWIATCGVADPGEQGTASWNAFYQHATTTIAGAFPIDQLNYPCGPDWVIIPGSDPVVPPVYIGTKEPFTPSTNVDGGWIFGAAQDIGAQGLAGELADAGVPMSASGQIVGYGADGVAVYTADWWGLTPAVKNAAAAVMLKHGAYPGAVWRTDSFHWGYGNIGVGLPTQGSSFWNPVM